MLMELWWWRDTFRCLKRLKSRMPKACSPMRFVSFECCSLARSSGSSTPWNFPPGRKSTSCRSVTATHPAQTAFRMSLTRSLLSSVTLIKEQKTSGLGLNPTSKRGWLKVVTEDFQWIQSPCLQELVHLYYRGVDVKVVDVTTQKLPVWTCNPATDQQKFSLICYKITMWNFQVKNLKTTRFVLNCIVILKFRPLNIVNKSGIQ